MLNDEELLRYLPFLNNSGLVLRLADLTIEKLENTKTFDYCLAEIYKEISTLLIKDIQFSSIVEPVITEVSKFYMTILVLKGIDNIAITRIWVKHIVNKVNFILKDCLTVYKTTEERMLFFQNVFRLLEKDEYFKFKQITIDGDIAFGIHMLKYLDLADSLQDDTTILHKGYVIIPVTSYDFLIRLVEKFVQKKIYKLYEQAVLDVSITRKIKFVVDKIRQDVINQDRVSINVKKHFIKKELLEEQERVKDVEKANIIINQLEDLPKDKIEGIDIQAFPPCINKLFNKMLIQKQQLSHNENILLCTYLGKKHFDINQVKKIFSKAVNYNRGTTDYQVSFLFNKKMMCMNCENLNIEGICCKEADKTNQCGRIKNPLSFR